MYLAEKQLSKLPTTILLLKHVLETLRVLWIHGEIQRTMVLSLANRKRRARGHFTMSVSELELYLAEETFFRLFISITLLTRVYDHISFDSNTAKLH